jgi:hypothetical protein
MNEDPYYSREELASRQFWHITGRKGFKPSDKERPWTTGGSERAGSPLLYVTTNPFMWGEQANWTRGRKWAAEVDLSGVTSPVRRANDLAEVVVDTPSEVVVKRVIPKSHATAETAGWLNGNRVPRGWRSGDPEPG